MTGCLAGIEMGKPTNLLPALQKIFFPQDILEIYLLEVKMQFENCVA